MRVTSFPALSASLTFLSWPCAQPAAPPLLPFLADTHLSSCLYFCFSLLMRTHTPASTFHFFHRPSMHTITDHLPSTAYPFFKTATSLKGEPKPPLPPFLPCAPPAATAAFPSPLHPAETTPLHSSSSFLLCTTSRDPCFLSFVRNAQAPAKRSQPSREGAPAKGRPSRVVKSRP